MFHTTYDKDRKQWNGLKFDCIFNPKTSLGNALLNVMQVNGPRVAQICANTNRPMTYRELRELTISAAMNLRKLGCRKGHVMSFFTDNSGDVVPLMCAALCLGCKLSGQPLECTQSERDYFLNLVKPNFVFCDAKEYDLLKERLVNARNDAKMFIFDGQVGEASSVGSLFENVVADPYFVPAEIDGENDIAFIATTSGTTSQPKGALLSHAMVLDKVRRFSEFIGTNDVLVGFNSIGGVSGIRFYMGAILNGATRVSNQGSYSPERFFELVERFKVTYTLVLAIQTTQLIKHPQFESADLSSVKIYSSGGTKLFPHVVRRMNERLTNGKLCQTFGMAETASTIALNLMRPTNDSVGQLISGCEAKIVNDNGDRLGPNENGELCFKLPYMFRGYLTDGENAPGLFDDEGFFATGDIARFDEVGDLFIVDRKKLIFKSAGGLVIPSEIEGFLNQMDGVKLSCCVSIPGGNGDLLPAVVIVKSENSKCNEESIYNAVLDSFEPHKRLRGGVYFIPQFPISIGRKIARPLVAQMAIEFYSNKKKNLN